MWVLLAEPEAGVVKGLPIHQDDYYLGLGVFTTAEDSKTNAVSVLALLARSPGLLHPRHPPSHARVPGPVSICPECLFCFPQPQPPWPVGSGTGLCQALPPRSQHRPSASFWFTYNCGKIVLFPMSSPLFKKCL